MVCIKLDWVFILYNKLPNFCKVLYNYKSLFFYSIVPSFSIFQLKRYKYNDTYVYFITIYDFGFRKCLY